MLSERTRNTLVGLTMLVALVVTMYGILLLGKFKGSGIHTYNITLLTPNAGGVVGSDKVELNGVVVGQVVGVDLQEQPATTRAAGDSGGGGASASTQSILMARLILQIDDSVNISSSARVTIEKPSVGNAMVSILVNTLSGPMFPHDGLAVIMGAPADTGLIPREVITDINDLKADLSPLARSLTTVARDLHVLLDYNTPEAIDNADPNDPNRPRENFSTAVVRADRTIKSLQTLLADPALQGQVREAVQNIVDASKQLKSTLQNVDATIKTIDTTIKSAGGAVASIGGAATQATATFEAAQREVARVSQQLADTLGQVEKTVRQIGEGNGTTGKLINDPRLYEGLNDLSKSLRSTVDDLDFLLKKWKDEGVDLHLK